MAYINIDVELSSVDTDDLVDELSDRYISTDRLVNLVTCNISQDAQKLKLFLRAMDRYSVAELEEILREPLPPVVKAKNQMRLAI